jgi:hypothetical protein
MDKGLKGLAQAKNLVLVAVDRPRIEVAGERKNCEGAKWLNLFSVSHGIGLRI